MCYFFVICLTEFIIWVISPLSNIDRAKISQNWTLQCGFWLVTGPIFWKWINSPNDIFCMLNSMINAARHNSHKLHFSSIVWSKSIVENIFFCSTFGMGLEIDIFPTVFHKASAFAVPMLGRMGYGIRAKCWRRSTSLESAAKWV